MDPIYLILFSSAVTIAMFGFMIYIIFRFTKMFDNNIKLIRDLMDAPERSTDPPKPGRSPIHKAMDPDRQKELERKFREDGIYKE